MIFTVNPDTIAKVWSLLTAPNSYSPSWRPERLGDFVRMYEIEDPAHWFGREAIEDLCRALELPLRAVTYQPRKRATFASGGHALAKADFIALLIHLERLGLPVDPAPLVEAILPAVRQKAEITFAELRAVWFDRERHRASPVMLVAGGSHSDEIRTPATHVTATGYRAKMIAGPAGPIQLTVTAPGRRARKAAA